MPLLDHFHPPLHGPRRWEGFHHAWATTIARQLNIDLLPKDYYAEPEISVGPEMEIDVATLSLPKNEKRVAKAMKAAPKPKFAVKVDFSQLEGFEIRIIRNLGGAELCAAIELVSPANKDRPGSRRTFAAKCAGYLKHGLGLMVVDIVTVRNENLHEELFDVLEVKTQRASWKSLTNLSAISYRAVTVRKEPRLEVWPETLALGKVLPVLPLWLSLDLSVSLDLEESYLTTCESLRISA